MPRVQHREQETHRDENATGNVQHTEHSTVHAGGIASMWNIPLSPQTTTSHDSVTRVRASQHPPPLPAWPPAIFFRLFPRTHPAKKEEEASESTRDPSRRWRSARYKCNIFGSNGRHIIYVDFFDIGQFGLPSFPFDLPLPLVSFSLNPCLAGSSFCSRFDRCVFLCLGFGLDSEIINIYPPAATTTSALCLTVWSFLRGTCRSWSDHSQWGSVGEHTRVKEWWRKGSVFWKFAI